jgi:hypothetical protein
LTYSPKVIKRNLDAMKVKPEWIYLLPRPDPEGEESERHAAAAEGARRGGVVDQ